ncbi:MAG: hypothetical protein ACRDJE_07405 [Dehalococcoidia bacterium]
MSDTDLDHLERVLMELHEAGREEEAAALARLFSVAQGIYIAEHFPDLDDDDPEFVQMMEDAERDIAAGRLIPHGEVVRRLQALDNG